MRVNSSMRIIKMLENNKHDITHDCKCHDKCDDKYDNKHGKIHGSKISIDDFYQEDGNLDKYQ